MFKKIESDYNVEFDEWDNIIKLAGGNNIFSDSKQPYIDATWESVVEKNPQVIVVTDYLSGPPVQEKINFLKNHPALKNVDAIKNNRIYVIGLADISPGVRNSSNHIAIS